MRVTCVKAGRLDDLPPGGNPLHGILPAERAAIVELCETWGDVDRSHRKLAHRGSRVGLVHVSESTVRRVLAEEDPFYLVIRPASRSRARSGRPGWSGSPTVCGG